MRLLQGSPTDHPAFRKQRAGNAIRSQGRKSIMIHAWHGCEPRVALRAEGRGKRIKTVAYLVSMQPLEIVPRLCRYAGILNQWFKAVTVSSISGSSNKR